MPIFVSASARRDSLHYLLYLYLWPFWMFKDADNGSLLERAAAYRHNRERRIYLPAYILKWTILFLLSLGSLQLIEQVGSACLDWRMPCVMLASATGIFASWAFVVTTQITVAYVLLCRWEQ